MQAFFCTQERRSIPTTAGDQEAKVPASKEKHIDIFGIQEDRVDVKWANEKMGESSIEGSQRSSFFLNQNRIQFHSECHQQNSVKKTFASFLVFAKEPVNNRQLSYSRLVLQTKLSVIASCCNPEIQQSEIL